MFRYLNKMMNKRKKGDKGAALVMVIVAVAFIGMLVSMILYMAFYNYQMKQTDKGAKDNFYSAESALDVINAGLQQIVSDSMAEAYVMTMQLSSGMDDNMMTQTFRDMYMDSITKALATNPSATAMYWKRNVIGDIWDKDTSIQKASSQGDEGAYLEGGYSSTDESTNSLLKSDSDLLLKNVNIYYTDSKGYVSIIRTNIRITIPDLQFAQAASALTLEDYSIIAHNALVNSVDFSYTYGGSGVTVGSNLDITGNVFGGKDGIYTRNEGKEISFVDDSADSKSDYDLIAGSLNAKNLSKIKVDSTHTNYFNDIEVDGATLDLAGLSFVQDDLTIDGKNSNVFLSGKYRGYGDSTSSAYNSSSILVNGANTTLNFSGLKELLLAGSAYVGATHYDANTARNVYAENGANNGQVNVTGADHLKEDYIEDIDEYNKIINGEQAPGNVTNPDPDATFTPFDSLTVNDAWNQIAEANPVAPVDPNATTTNPAPQPSEQNTLKNSTDILMGESVSVKANQMMYMVPADCIGFVRGSKKQVLAKNPMTIAEYRKLTDTMEEVEVERNGVKVKEEVNHFILYDLSSLTERLGHSYNVGVKEVYRRVNGQVLVYLYLDFNGNVVEANQFFKDYYEYDKDGFTNYVKSYINNVVWSSDLNANNSKNLTIAGNAIYFDNNKNVVLKSDTSQDEEKVQTLYENVQAYEDTALAMSTMLKTNLNEVTTGQRVRTPYQNIVDEDVVIHELSGSGTNKSETYENGDVKAIITRDDYMITSTDISNKVKLVISTGNVYVTCDFEGLIISGKDVVIASGCNHIKYNATEVLKAIRAEKDGKHVYEAFGSSGITTYATGSTGDTENKAVDLGSCISYDDWKKE